MVQVRRRRNGPRNWIYFEKTIGIARVNRIADTASPTWKKKSIAFNDLPNHNLAIGDIRLEED